MSESQFDSSKVPCTWCITNGNTVRKSTWNQCKSNTAILSISIQAYMTTPAFHILELLQMVSLTLTVVEKGWLRSNAHSNIEISTHMSEIPDPNFYLRQHEGKKFHLHDNQEYSKYTGSACCVQHRVTIWLPHSQTAIQLSDFRPLLEVFVVHSHPRTTEMTQDQALFQRLYYMLYYSLSLIWEIENILNIEYCNYICWALYCMQCEWVFQIENNFITYKASTWLNFLLLFCYLNCWLFLNLLQRSLQTQTMLLTLIVGVVEKTKGKW